MMNVFDFFGKGSTLMAFIMNVSEWMFSANFNMVLTLLISVLAILYWIMKIYDQYLITKNRKNNDTEV